MCVVVVVVVVVVSIGLGQTVLTYHLGDGQKSNVPPWVQQKAK